MLQCNLHFHRMQNTYFESHIFIVTYRLQGATSWQISFSYYRRKRWRVCNYSQLLNSHNQIHSGSWWLKAHSPLFLSSRNLLKYSRAKTSQLICDSCQARPFFIVLKSSVVAFLSNQRRVWQSWAGALDSSSHLSSSPQASVHPLTWQSQRGRSWPLCRPAARTSRCPETGD